jgi:hypothetical protein
VSQHFNEVVDFFITRLGETKILKTRVFRGEMTISEAKGKGELQGYKENATIRVHLFDMFFLHLKALFCTPF